jgi:SAM-dependent methyltransferase
VGLHKPRPAWDLGFMSRWRRPALAKSLRRRWLGVWSFLKKEDTTTQAYFERKYRKAADPWGFATSDYELGRYAAILSCLDGRRFQRAFEPGCSIGILTERLAGLCDELEASDISPTAVSRAQAHCRELKNVTIRHGGLPAAIPDGTFDLILLSEIGCYFEAEEWSELSRVLIGKLRTGGTLVASHWLGHSRDHKLTGDQVHEMLRALPGLMLAVSERHKEFRIDRWTTR